MSAEVDVVVVVVTFNSSEVVGGLIESLEDGLAGMTWHLVVADNDSADDSVSLVQRLAPGATVVRMGRNAGYAAGINGALAAAPRARAVLVLNPDVRLGLKSVEHLYAALCEPGVGIAVPRLEDARGHVIDSLRREPSLVRAFADALVGSSRAGRWGTLGEVVTDPAAYRRRGTSDWSEGSTQLISRECLDACGRWDETFFLYSEETEFHLRAKDAGFTLRYVPQASAVHLEGGSATSPLLWALLTANRLRLFRRRHGPLASALFWLALVLRESSRSFLGRPTARAALRVLSSPRMLRMERGPAWLQAAARQPSAPALRHADR